MANVLQVEVEQVSGIDSLKQSAALAASGSCYLEVGVARQHRRATKGAFTGAFEFTVGDFADEVVTFLLWALGRRGELVMAAQGACSLSRLVQGETLRRELVLRGAGNDEASSGGCATLSVKFVAVSFSCSKDTLGYVEDKDLQELYQKFQPQPVPLPTDKLLRAVKLGTNPVVIVACGSFSPPTNMHLRLMEDAKVALEAKGKYTVIGGYLSPVHTAYGKASLIENHHRVNLVKASVATSSWLMVDVFECCQAAWTRTAVVLDRIAQRLADISVEGSNAPPRVMFNCGADVLESMTKVKENGETVWIQDHLRIILEQNGVACLAREGTGMDAVIDGSPVLKKHKANIEVVHPAVSNDISSTAVRRELRSGAVKYLVPDAVAEYIREHDLASKPQWQP